jgi:hypothetical protein
MRRAIPDIPPAYCPRKPQDHQYYLCVEDHCEEYEKVMPITLLGLLIEKDLFESTCVVMQLREAPKEYLRN